MLPEVDRLGTIVVCEDDELTRELLCENLAADPDDLVRETNELDNATSVALRITGDSVRRGPPRRCR